jgi:hypothetical protein
MSAFWDMKPCRPYKCTDVSEVLTASIAVMMDAVRICKTPVYFYENIQSNIPERSHVHTCRCENLKNT